jgi:hypothetical protein
MRSFFRVDRLRLVGLSLHLALIINVHFYEQSYVQKFAVISTHRPILLLDNWKSGSKPVVREPAMGSINIPECSWKMPVMLYVCCFFQLERR